VIVVWLNNLASFLGKIANPVSRAMSGVGAGVLAMMMFLTALDVLLRYFLNRPISGALELTQFMMLIVVASGLAHCTMEKSHVRVEVLIERCPPKIQTALYTLTSFLCLGLFLVITWQAVVYAGFLRDANLTSPVLFIPVFPFAIILALGTAVFCLALLAEFVHFLSRAVSE
jgi:TRAP-type C4-dicarboxylate transport system permease small subunit